MSPLPYDDSTSSPARDVLDRPAGAVAHRDLGAGDEALIDVADDHDAAVVGGEEAHELELRGVGVLELVDEDVPEAVAVALERFGVLAEQPHREHEQIVEVDGRRFLQPALVLGVHVGEPPLGRRRRPSWRTRPGSTSSFFNALIWSCRLRAGKRFGSRLRSRRTQSVKRCASAWS